MINLTLSPTLILRLKHKKKKHYHLCEPYQQSTTLHAMHLLWTIMCICSLNLYYFASLRHSSFPQFLLTRQNWLTSVLLVVACLSHMPPQHFTVPRVVLCSKSQCTPHFTLRSVQPSPCRVCKRSRDATPCSSLMIRGMNHLE